MLKHKKRKEDMPYQMERDDKKKEENVAPLARKRKSREP